MIKKVLILFFALLPYVQTYENKYMTISWKRVLLVPDDHLNFETRMLLKMFQKKSGTHYFGQYIYKS